LGLDYTFIKARESSNIKAYFTKRTPNMGGSISEAKYIPFWGVLLMAVAVKHNYKVDIGKGFISSFIGPMLV